ncbi:MAG: aminoacyl-histidine dipeptidase [Bacteroidales bacterium]|nr:aminoacyl-histidine dipeptidase [Bacteroidales bacterium]MDD4670413.1 aminoacyl-histidine dipeptidase [Bacteroidales bacterium]
MDTEKVLSFFREIVRIPRESGHEEQIIAYLQQFASDRKLECKTDKIGNVLIVKPASKGCENRPVVILQSHSDMVCEKNGTIEHDFAKDPIKYVIEDGWMIAKDTTLGADCGIGIASQLAILDDNSLEHGKIEALFTVSEETGLDGAKAIKPDFLSGKILLNLDSEDEGELFVGCAGGIDTTAVFTYRPKQLAAGRVVSKFGIGGAVGGHSGDDIDKGRANAVQLLARFLYEALEYKIDLCEIEGGNKRNAIAREAYAVIAFSAKNEDKIVSLFNRFADEIKMEYEVTDPDIKVYAEPVKWNKPAMDAGTAKKLIASLNSAPHGVLSMSADIKGLVETSSNLASVKMGKKNTVRIGSSQRSSINSARHFAAQRFEADFVNAGAEVTHESEYPGWKPNMNSPIKDICVASYIRLFGNKPVVRAIHAGLECGLFLEKYPDLDMISFGPTLRGVHAPGERLDLASLDKFWKLLIDVLKNIK